MTTPLPAPAPVITPDTAAFWAATKTGVLLLQRCAACRRTIWYPKAFCNSCGSLEVTAFEASGQGEIYSFTEVRRGETAYRETPSFVLALVELDEGVRMLTNIVATAPGDLRVGQRVRVVFDDAGETAALPRFQPIDSAS